MTCIGPIDLMLYLANSGDCREFLSQTFMANGIPPWKDYLIALGLTLLIETPIYVLFLRKKYTLRKSIIIVMTINLMTHPAVWFLWPKLLSALQVTIGGYLTMSEVFAPLVEALALRFLFRTSTKIAVTSSILANLISWWIGVYLLAPGGS